MSARVISIANSKGGVGKTTTCVSLAEAFAASGRRTLVVDLDTQANASLLVYGHEGDEHLFQAINDYATISDWLLENFFANEQKRLSDFVVTNASDVSHDGKPLPLDLIPSSPRLRKTERELIYELTAKKYSMEALQGQVGRRLRDDFNLLKADYDVIICDCPPGISVMTESVLAASHLIIVPTIPDFMSTLGLDLFTGDIMANLRDRDIESLPVVLATRFDNTPHQQVVLQAMREAAKSEDAEFEMFDTVIPLKTGFATNPIELGPDPTLAAKWPGDALSTIQKLLNEVQERLK
ncbi:ParA family protein [Hyphomonas johnsonii]|jgi:cellulose biosynthesis protein BcsQ|uniref:CobQ/CobB/MinD/ParA nucleotide binding domain-containing protein n=1 Tax=Hyphomonas johnsonii MHS-2 TaxID=1280950 RepID=A0A059FTI6_9PROT|nr:AAA family ATPase [Hyphomonas johnsonii]KCZ93773.1 CobQ/CobB/MinD/ParA nucleotide binding domain-containing protein [Hyphomonas johnsonii MHS-2]